MPATKRKSLTDKERRFVDAYLGSANGNGTAAAKAAGYKGNAKVLGVQSARMLGKASIRLAIGARQARRETKAILTADERDARLSEIALQADTTVAVAAIRELNKCGGRHSIRHVVDGKLTLEQILTESRK